MKEIKAVLFDLDGVIVDTAVYHYQAWKKLADREGLSFDETVNERLKGVSRRESLEIILHTNGRSCSEEEKVRLMEDKNTFYVEMLSHLTAEDILPGIMAFLGWLKEAGLRTAVCSVSKNTGTILKNLELEQWFDVVITGNDIKNSKPDPEVFLLAMNRLGLGCDDCLVIEDSAAGIQAAAACGMRSIGIGKKESFKEASLVVETTEKLTPSLLKRLEKRPNIVIFNPDQFRCDALHHMGNRASITPNLDRMSKEDGVSFSNAYTQNPVCTPSRCSFMTGLYPHVNGHRTIFSMVRPDEITLLQSLKENGYFVWWGGKNDLISADRGFDMACHVHHKAKKPIRDYFQKEQSWRGPADGDNYYSFYRGEIPPCDEESYNDKDWAHIDGAVEFLHSYDKDGETGPFCLYLPLGFPHPPYRAEEPFFSSIDRDNLEPRVPVSDDPNMPKILQGIRENQHLEGWSEERWKELRATYLAMVSRIDYQYGLLVQALKEAGVYDDTMIFVFSDHGDFTGDYGLVEKNQNTFQDCLTNVPFLMKPPAWMEVKTGINEELVELVDFYATAMEAAGIKPPHTHFGNSLLPVLAGEAGKREFVFCEGGRNPEETHTREAESTVNTKPTGLYWPRISIQLADGPEHGKAAMFRSQGYKYVKRLYETDEFYDLQKDPKELHNAIFDEEYQDMIREFKNKALDFYMRTCDVVKLKPDRR